MKLAEGYHLTYCTNIHPGESWEEVFENLKKHIPSLQKSLVDTRPFGIGLRLSNLAAEELLKRNNLRAFKNWLNEHNLYVFTINGFPYGGFHHQKVKDEVHRPDWSMEERVKYTCNLFSILAQLLPAHFEGSISTSPISYKPWFIDNPQQVDEINKTAALNLARVVEHILKLEKTYGCHLHLDIEPEPDGFLENSEEVVSYFTQWLIPVGGEYLLHNKKLPLEEAEQALFDHIQVCYDVCHFALGYENPERVLAHFQKAGIKIGKIQISAALKVQTGYEQALTEPVFEELSRFQESTYLHQVVEKTSQGQLVHYADLPVALTNWNPDEKKEWRVHFHVPIFIDQYNHLQSTQDDIINVLQHLKSSHFTRHLEVETYTYDVLPDELKFDLNDSIRRELQWVINNF